MKKQEFNEKLNQILKTNPRKIYGAKWILDENCPYWFVEFPQIQSGASFSGGFKITLGLLLELWREFPELKIKHKESGDILYVIQMGRLLSGSYSITAYNETANRVDSFRNPTSKNFVSIDGSAIFSIFREAQGRLRDDKPQDDRSRLTQNPNILDEFLEATLSKS